MAEKVENAHSSAQTENSSHYVGGVLAARILKPPPRCRTSTAGHQVTAGGREMSVLIERHFSVHKSTPLYAALRHMDNKSCEGFSIEFNFAYFK